MASGPSVVVTRPEGQAQPLIDALTRRGIRVRHLPMLAVRAIPLDAEARRAVQDLDLYQHVIFVSSNAARFGLDCLGDRWPQWPVGVNWYAVGDSTAAVLNAHGLSVHTPGSNMTSEGLLALPSLQVLAGQRVLLVRGAGGRRALAETLAERGARVDALVCYRREAPVHDADALIEALSADLPEAILVSSGEGLDNLSALLKPGENTNLAAMHLVVPSARVADQARALGWSSVSIAANASDDAMQEALLSRRAEGENAQ